MVESRDNTGYAIDWRAIERWRNNWERNDCTPKGEYKFLLHQLADKEPGNLVKYR